LGVSILPKVSITEKDEQERLKVIKLENIELKRMFKIVYHKDKIVERQFEKVINIINSSFAVQFHT
jgi:DNA-binding transcriptional LysR family regulator